MNVCLAAEQLFVNQLFAAKKAEVIAAKKGSGLEELYSDDEEEGKAQTRKKITYKAWAVNDYEEVKEDEDSAKTIADNPKLFNVNYKGIGFYETDLKIDGKEWTGKRDILWSWPQPTEEELKKRLDKGKSAEQLEQELEDEFKRPEVREGDCISLFFTSKTQI